METTIKSFVLFTTVILTGLSAGLFYAWTVSVIPGTQRIMDATYLETMQAINKAILNKGFYLIFFGSLIGLSISSVYEFHSNRLVFWTMLLASIIYLVGTFGVTVWGNVPLNNKLEGLDLAHLGKQKIAAFRQFYELKWNQYHYLRTGCSVLSFILTVLAVFLELRR